MLSFGFRIFCWYRGFCHRTGSDLLLFLFGHSPSLMSATLKILYFKNKRNADRMVSVDGLNKRKTDVRYISF